MLAPADGQVLVRNRYLSLDPTNRIWASGAQSYLPAMKLGEVMRGVTLGEVIASRDPRVEVGACVTGLLGWQDYALVRTAAVQVLQCDPRRPVTDYLGVLGNTGLTAYFGLLDVGTPRSGETVLVSAAAGAVGSLVGQIARIQGCRTVGLVGTASKARWLTEELGFDGAINYREENVPEAIARECPSGVDIYFDNVGGEILDAAMGQLNLRGRMQAFIVIDYLSRANEAYVQIADWLEQGRLQYRVDIVKGLEHAPAALGQLFDGSNVGKLLVQM